MLVNPVNVGRGSYVAVTPASLVPRLTPQAKEFAK